MNRPWAVQAFVKMLCDAELNHNEFELGLMRILGADDPGGFWVDGEREIGRDLLDSIGVTWDDVKDIYEEELNDYARLHAYEYEQDKKARDLP